MSNSLLVNLLPGDGSARFRRAVLQQWYEQMALAFQAKYGGTVPTTGGYLIDCTTDDVPQTVACATVAWVRNAAQQI